MASCTVPKADKGTIVQFEKRQDFATLNSRMNERWRSAYETNALLAEFGIARPLLVRTSRGGADMLFARCIDRLFRLDALDQWSHCTFHHNCRDFG